MLTFLDYVLFSQNFQLNLYCKRVIAPKGTTPVMKINIKMVTLSKIYDYNFTLEKYVSF